jgi:hypothetical protein
VTTTVTTQAELDAAVTAGADDIVVNSPAGVWLTVRGSSSVVALGSSRVVALGSSRVVALGSSSVVAWGSSSVVARDSSSVVAWGSSHVEAWGSSHVEARGSSHVEARGSSSVEARDSSNVVARDNGRVEAGAYVAIHLWSRRVALTGGVVIDMTTLDLTDRETWLAYHGVKVASGKATLYKAVDAGLNAGQGYTLTAYPIGSTVTAPDWRDTATCGHGLHFGVTPAHARTYYNGSGTPRFLAVEVDAAALVPLGDKVKAPSCRVVAEVDVHGDPVGPWVEAAP